MTKFNATPEILKPSKKVVWLRACIGKLLA